MGFNLTILEKYVREHPDQTYSLEYDAKGFMAIPDGRVFRCRLGKSIRRHLIGYTTATLPELFDAIVNETGADHK